MIRFFLFLLIFHSRINYTSVWGDIWEHSGIDAWVLVARNRWMRGCIQYSTSIEFWTIEIIINSKATRSIWIILLIEFRIEIGLWLGREWRQTWTRWAIRVLSLHVMRWKRRRVSHCRINILFKHLRSMMLEQAMLFLPFFTLRRSDPSTHSHTCYLKWPTIVFV